MTLPVRNASAIVKHYAARLRVACNTRSQEKDPMQLSTVVASVALILAAALAVGHALGQDTPPRSESQIEPRLTIQKRVDEREAQRRAAAADQQKKRELFARQCN